MGLRDDCQTKLDDAKQQYSDMQANLADQQEFRRHLAAFLSSIRSPLQYIFGASGSVSRMENWYQLKMRNSSILRFFRDERNSDIHATPVRPRGTATVNIQEVVAIGDELVVISVENGRREVIAQVGMTSESTDATPTDNSAPETTFEYLFDNWTATNDPDVMRLCQQCIDEVDLVITEGIKHGYLI